jgi:hypothetical protein
MIYQTFSNIAILADREFTPMKKIIFAAILPLLSINIFSQTPTPTQTPSRPRVVITNSITPTPTPNSSPTPRPTPLYYPTVTPTPRVVVTNPNYPTYPTPTPFATPLPTPTPRLMPQANAYRQMNYGQLKAKIAQARTLMQTRPMPTAMSDFNTDIIRLAYNDYKANQIDFVMLTKTVFLSKDTELTTTSAEGKTVYVRIMRANGVNTQVILLDENDKPHTPLLVQYPIEKGGSFTEMAFYTSAHNGVVTPEVINAGKLYVKNTIDTARQKLKEKGVFIQPIVADMAERLATVEHVDHQRFKTEYQLNVFNDIFTLYALNEGNTYRYSVSRAGAGGMVQMIPSTYFMVRNRYYAVNLLPDFVDGMKNHANATQAMLLYMQMTWDDLISSETIYNAIENGVARPVELMSAGYNSNPSKLAGYIKRGGNNWRNLIPKETQIYLQINASLDRFIPLVSRTQ